MVRTKTGTLRGLDTHRLTVATSQEISKRYRTKVREDLDHGWVWECNTFWIYPLLARLTHLDAIFVCVGGGSLLAGVAAAVKQIMPTTKVIGVEPSDYDVLNRSLLSGHRVSLPEPGHFVDGAAVRVAYRSAQPARPRRPKT